jgi:hypothetical protein
MNSYANYKKTAGAYVADVRGASARAGRYSVAVTAGWVAFPFALQTVMHPTDAIWVQLKVQGLPVPHVFTAQQAAAGFVEAVIALAVLVLLQMVCTVLFYRRAKMESKGKSIATPALWPVAALLTGVLGNAAWFYGAGAFDPGGCAVGLSSAVLTIGGELLCNRLGREFVFGPAKAVGAFG